jgi:hypothetical protein
MTDTLRDRLKIPGTGRDDRNAILLGEVHARAQRV